MSIFNELNSTTSTSPDAEPEAEAQAHMHAASSGKLGQCIKLATIQLERLRLVVSSFDPILLMRLRSIHK